MRGRADCRSAAPAGTRPSRSRCRGRPPAGAGLRRGAEEHVLPGPRAGTRSCPTTSATWRTAETLRSFTEGIEHYRRLFDVEPAVVAHDLHPEYLSTKYALELRRGGAGRRAAPPRAHRVVPGRQRRGRAGDRAGLRRHRLRHRTATLWGGEVLVADLAGFRRAGHLRAGAAAGRGGGDPGAVADGGGVADVRPASTAPSLAVARRNAGRWAAVGRRSARAGSPRRRPPAPAGCSTPWRRCSACATRSTTRARPRSSWSRRRWTSSRPRPVRAGGSCGPSAGSSVLAAAAARIGPGDRRSGGLSRAGYGARVEGGLLCGSDLVGGVVDDLRAGIDVPVIAARFHAGLAGLLARARRRTRAPPPASTPSRSPAACSRTCCCCACSSPSWRPPDSGCSPTPGSPERRGREPGPGRGRGCPGHSFG